MNERLERDGRDTDYGSIRRDIIHHAGANALMTNDSMTSAHGADAADADMEARIMRAIATRTAAESAAGPSTDGPKSSAAIPDTTASALPYRTSSVASSSASPAAPTAAPDSTLGAPRSGIPWSRRERAIMAAVREGIPERPTLWSTLVRARGSLRLRDLFFGTWDCVAVALMMTATVWMVQLVRVMSGGERVFAHPGLLYAGMFLTAPFLYEATHLLVRFREHEQRTDELLRTMRWSFVRLCALRMLVIGAAAATLIVAYGLYVNALAAQVGFDVAAASTTASRFSLTTLMGVAFSALFLFGIAQLAADVHCRWPWSMAVVPGVWVALGAVLLVWHDALAPLMAGLPPAVALVSAVVTGVAYLAAMNRFVRISPAITRFA